MKFQKSPLENGLRRMVMADVEKKTIQIELEVDTKTVDSSKNPY